MKIIFFGSDSFASEPLERLIASRHELVGVVGRPDRPVGRGLTEGATPVVARARELDLWIWQPESLSETSFGATARDA